MKVSVILPVASGQELILSLVISSLDIASQAPPTLKNPRLEVSMSKIVSVHGLSITTSLINTNFPVAPPISTRLTTARTRVKEPTPQVDILLCPAYFNLSIWGYRATNHSDTKSGMIHLTDTTENVVGIEGSVSNLEFLVNESQLTYIQQFVSLIASRVQMKKQTSIINEFWSIGRKYYMFKRLLFMRFYFASIDTHPVSVSVSDGHSKQSRMFVMDAKTKFLFAVRTIILMNRLRRGNFDRTPLMRLLSTRLLEHYSLLYRRYLSDKFTEFKVAVPESAFLNYNDITDSSSIYTYTTTTTTSSCMYFEDYSSTFTSREILLYRILVYISLFRANVRAKSIRRVLYETYKSQFPIHMIASDGYLTGWNENPSFVSFLQGIYIYIY